MRELVVGFCIGFGAMCIAFGLVMSVVILCIAWAGAKARKGGRKP